jgi:PPE-repeat protein
LVDYAYNIYNDYKTITSSTVFKSNITVPPTLLLNNFGNKRPIVNEAKIVSDTSAMEQISNGVYRYTIKVPFVNEFDLPTAVDTVQAEIQLTDSTESAGTTLFNTPVNSGSVSINNVEVNKQYSIRLRYFGKTGNVGKWTNTFIHTVIGKSANYQTVDSVDVVKSKRNLVITPKSSSVPNDFNYYEIRIWKNDSIGDFWISTDSAIKKFTTIDSVSIDLRTFDKPRISHNGIKYRVACRARDTSGNYSPVSALASITLYTILP